MRRLAKDVCRGKRPETSLYEYGSGMMERYYEYSFVRLAINYYGFCEIRAGEEKEQREASTPENDVVSEFMEEFDRIIEDISGTADGRAKSREEQKERIRSVRKKVMEKMEILTAYTDIFHLYEHVLNRVEYRFRDDELPGDYSDEEFCRKIMRYIVQDEDAAVVNSKIGEILGQLPVRITRQKFFQLLDTGLSVYKGTDRKGLDDFLYRIRTSAALKEPEADIPGFEDLALAVRKFKDCDYTNITKEDYDDLFSMIGRLSRYLTEISSQCMLLMEQLNDAYVILASGEYVSENSDRVKACEGLLKAAGNAFHSEGQSPDEAEDMLVFLEGSQEELSEQLGAYGYAVEEALAGQRENLEKYGLTGCYQELSLLADLTSGSIFIDMDRENGKEAEVDEVYLEEKKGILYHDLEVFFQENGRMVNRGVMAAVIAQLPVFFQNLTQLQDFIYLSLDKCRDRAEKLACIEILNGIMEA